MPANVVKKCKQCYQQLWQSCASEMLTIVLSEMLAVIVSKLHYNFSKCWQSWVFEILVIITSKIMTIILCWNADKYNFRNADKYTKCLQLYFWYAADSDFPKCWQPSFSERLATIFSEMPAIIITKTLAIIIPERLTITIFRNSGNHSSQVTDNYDLPQCW